MDLIYITRNPCNLSKPSGPDHSLFKRLFPASRKTQNILIVNLCFFLDPQENLWTKKGVFNFRDGCTVDVGATVCYMAMSFACYRCMAYPQVADGGDDLWVLKVI